MPVPSTEFKTYQVLGKIFRQMKENEGTKERKAGRRKERRKEAGMIVGLCFS